MKLNLTTAGRQGRLPPEKLMVKFPFLISLPSLFLLSTSLPSCSLTTDNNCLVQIGTGIWYLYITLYKTLVRCHLEYANSVWNPHRQGLIKDLKKGPDESD